MPTVNVKVNQTLFAIMDPHWGSPVVIPETIRPSIDGAKDAVLWMSEHSLYHGGSHFDDSEGGCKGKWAGLAAQGYKVVEFNLTQVQTEALIGTHN